MRPDLREAERRILERRADQLARIDSEEDAADDLELVVVRCGGTEYGLETRHVQEIQPLRHVAPLPQNEGVWAGLINIRGVIYAVLWLARYLGATADPPTVQQVVILGSAEDAMGLLVDETLRVDRVRVGDLRPPPDSGSSRPSAVRGMTPSMLPVLDVEAILDDPDLSGPT